MVRPGATIEQIHERAIDLLTDGMVRLGWLAGEARARIEDGTYKSFYPHRTSHWLGLDVHDAGIYFPGGKARPLAPGMVLTVEPGLYAPLDAAVPDAFKGLGIRIEDDVLVTESGFEVLTRAIPKEVADLEEIARSRS
jgi:Xaa-Pro aminopeptidase